MDIVLLISIQKEKKKQYLHNRKFVIDEQSQKSTRNHQEFDTKCIMISIISCSEFDPHQIQSTER